MVANMKLAFSVTLYLAFIMAVFADANVAEDSLSQLVVQLNADSKPTQLKLLEALATLPMEMPTEPKVVITQGIYLLYGDMFHNGKCYAVADLTSLGCIGFAVRNGAKWDCCGLWQIGSQWRPEGWENDVEEHLPIRPAKSPFWLQHLSDDKVPELVIAGDVWKYWQEHFIMRFDAKTGLLDLSSKAMEAPFFKNDWIVLPFHSGHRSIYSGYSYCKWVGTKLVENARWQSGINENDKAECDPDKLLKFSQLEDGGNSTQYEVKFLASEDDASDVARALISKNGQQYAKIEVTWGNDSKTNEFRDLLVEQWIYLRLTKLPKTLFPDFETVKHLNLKEAAQVRVTGKEEAVKAFRIQ